MKAKIKVEDLDEATRNRIGLPADPGEETISKRLVGLGRVLNVLKGLTRNDATWILSQGLYAIQKEEADQDGVGVGEEEVKPTTMAAFSYPIGFMLYTVAKAFDLEIADLLARSRTMVIAEARQVAMYILWNAESYTQTKIGQVLGGRHPSTISHGYRQIASRLLSDNGLKKKVEGINEAIGKGESSDVNYLLTNVNT